MNVFNTSREIEADSGETKQEISGSEKQLHFMKCFPLLYLWMHSFHRFPCLRKEMAVVKCCVFQNIICFFTSLNIIFRTSLLPLLDL